VAGVAAGVAAGDVVEQALVGGPVQHVGHVFDHLGAQWIVHRSLLTSLSESSCSRSRACARDTRLRAAASSMPGGGDLAKAGPPTYRRISAPARWVDSASALRALRGELALGGGIGRIL
jgi:hypothetical protein